jgi:predicted ATP-grasp superfamily ATP-dependent carboligase
MKVCVQVQVTVRRFGRNTQKIQKHFVRGAAFSVVPDILNDVAFHHTNVDVHEIARVVQDISTVSALNIAIASLLYEAQKNKKLVKSCSVQLKKLKRRLNTKIKNGDLLRSDVR